MRETVLKPRKCEECGKPFTPRSILSTNARYCCDACRKAASNKKAKQKKLEEERLALAALVGEDQDYLSISEAIAIFQVSHSSIYRDVKRERIASIRISVNKIRIKRDDIAALYPTRKEHKEAVPVKPEPTLYNMERENCYTIGEIAEKFHINDSTVYTNIRKHHIPTCQYGRFVCAPKPAIDKLFSDKL